MPQRISILSRYLFRELLTPFLLCLFVFTTILFLLNLLQLLDMVVNKSVPLGEMLLLFLFMIPRFFEIALPMALLLGTIVAIGRMSADSELVALRAAGISLRSLTRPVFFFSFCVFCLGLLLSSLIRPWSEKMAARQLFSIARTKASAGLIPGVFNEMGPLMIYAETITQPGTKLERVVVSQRNNEANSNSEQNQENAPAGAGADQIKPGSQQTVFVARHGQIASNEQTQTLTIWLYNGSIHEGPLKQHSITTFDVNSISVPYGLLLDDDRSSRGPKPTEMDTASLMSRVHELRSSFSTLGDDDKRQYYRAVVEFYRRLSLPFASLCVPLLALALGVQPSRSESRWGITVNVSVGLVAVLIYYFLVALATALAETGVIPAFVGMWTPNVLFLLVAFAVFRQIETERWLAVSEAIGSSLGSLGQRIFERLSPMKVEAAS